MPLGQPLDVCLLLLSAEGGPGLQLTPRQPRSVSSESYLLLLRCQVNLLALVEHLVAVRLVLWRELHARVLQGVPLLALVVLGLLFPLGCAHGFAVDRRAALPPGCGCVSHSSVSSQFLLSKPCTAATGVYWALKHPEVSHFLPLSSLANLFRLAALMASPLTWEPRFRLAVAARQHLLSARLCWPGITREAVGDQTNGGSRSSS